MKYLAQIDQNKAAIDTYRPLEGKMLQQTREYYRVASAYSSNAIEGNTLTENETRIILEDGLTVGGKPLRDIYEAVGHGEAYDYMFSLIGSGTITLDNIRQLNHLFYRQIDPENAGTWRRVPIFVSGTEYAFPLPEAVESEMQALEAWITGERDQYHPVQFAALLHLRFVAVHPYIDGNGRTARLLCNLALIQRGYLPVIVPPILKAEYNDCIRAYQNKGNAQPFADFIAEQEIETQRGMMRMLHIR